MLSFSNRKGQFFILTAVVIVGVFYILSKYINPYSFIDTSEQADSGEVFFFNNIMEKTNKTVQISNPDALGMNLASFRTFAQQVATGKGYKLTYNYNISSSKVDVFMVLESQKYTLMGNFTVRRP